MNEKLYLEDEENLGIKVDESYDQVYCRPDTLTDVPFHYCPGCGHSVVHKVLMEVIDELGIQEETIGVAPVGCSKLYLVIHGCKMNSINCFYLIIFEWIDFDSYKNNVNILTR